MVDIPLNKLVGFAGIFDSGKSSLALGVLYAEGHTDNLHLIWLEKKLTLKFHIITNSFKRTIKEWLIKRQILKCTERN